MVLTRCGDQALVIIACDAHVAKNDANDSSLFFLDAYSQVSGVTKGSGTACSENALSMPAPRARRTKKNLDTTRYARAEVGVCHMLVLLLCATCRGLTACPVDVVRTIAPLKSVRTPSERSAPHLCRALVHGYRGPCFSETSLHMHVSAHIRHG